MLQIRNEEGNLQLGSTSVKKQGQGVNGQNYNNFTMNRKQLLNIYQNYEGKLLKKSTQMFIGYQQKFWKILDNGTKIGFRGINDNEFLPQKVFNLNQIHTEQVQQLCDFLLHTPHRIYQLRAESEDIRKQWMRVITKLKKQLRRANKPPKNLQKPILFKNMNDSTMPSIDPFNIVNSTTSVANHSIAPRFTDIGASKLSSSLFRTKMSVDEQIKDQFKMYFKKLGQNYLDFHVFVTKLSIKKEQFLFSKQISHFYVLFSSKSLVPDQFISEENLTSSQLPHWAQIDGFYRISEQVDQCKLIFQLKKVEQIKQLENSIKITANSQIFQFNCDIVSKKRLKQVLQIGKINAIESSESPHSKKNYDNLIFLHSSNLEQFNSKVNEMLGPCTPKDHSFQPQILKKYIDNLSPLIIEILETLQNKITIPKTTIVDFLRIIHEDVRRHLKLVWDSSNAQAKGADILNILKSISRYQNLVNNYVKDLQMDDALKQLSKFYMRICYKNFQAIILSIVNQEKKNNYFIVEQENEEPHYETHGVTDLFKFIYDVFEMAIPCWNNRLHLHNINRLIKRSLTVFIRELKATIDEEDISEKQLIAISNSYVRFNEEVQQFYEAKLSELKEQTKETYDELRNQYREISMIVIDKLVLPLKVQLKVYFEKQGFYGVSLEEVYKKIIQSKICQYAKFAHFIFKKRYYERIFGCIKEEICRSLEKQAKKVGKKKPELSKFLGRIDVYKKECLEIASVISSTKTKIEKQFEQIKMLLITNKRDDIKTIISQSSEFYKRSYKNILNLRPDFYEGTQLYQFIHSPQNEFLFKELKVQSPSSERRRSSFSKQYIQQLDRHSISSSIEKQKPFEKEKNDNIEQKIRMISEGYVKRPRHNNNQYENIYLKIKKTVLYIYQNERMERCQNTIQLQDVCDVYQLANNASLFVISFVTLNRPKQMRILCDNMDQCNRWLYSIQLEMRRINNDKIMKSKGIKIKQKKSKLVIDYDQIMNGPDYFSYHT